MKTEASTRTLVAILVVVAAAVALLDAAAEPEDEGKGRTRRPQVEGLQTTLSQSQSEVAAAETAKRKFPKNYRQLVDPRQGGPGRRRNRLAAGPAEHGRAEIRQRLRLDPARRRRRGDRRATGTESPGRPSARAPSPDRGRSGAAAARRDDRPGRPRRHALRPGLHRQLLPHRRLHQGDRLAWSTPKTPASSVDGRLMTINGFSLSKKATPASPTSQGNFSVTTYLDPARPGPHRRRQRDRAGGR